MNLQSYRLENNDIVLLADDDEHAQILSALHLAVAVLYNEGDTKEENVIRELLDALYV